MGQVLHNTKQKLQPELVTFILALMKCTSVMAGLHHLCPYEPQMKAVLFSKSETHFYLPTTSSWKLCFADEGLLKHKFIPHKVPICPESYTGTSYASDIFSCYFTDLVPDKAPACISIRLSLCFQTI